MTPLSNWKLPKPEKPNIVEAFVIKREHGPRDVTLDKMPWPPSLGGSFRADVEEYAATMEALAMRMLPIYARALDLPHDYFAPAFESPLWRLRLNRYPAKLEGYEEKEFGISPHVDTSFFTILQQGVPGLCVHDQQHGRWLRAPVLPKCTALAPQPPRASKRRRIRRPDPAPFRPRRRRAGRP